MDKEDLIASLGNIETSFNSLNEFRLLAPENVAKGILALCDDTEDEYKQRFCAAQIMDMISNNVPKKISENVSRSGRKTVVETPMYSANFSEPMIKEIWAKYKEVSVTKAHAKRHEAMMSFLSTYKPTCSLGDSLYRLSFYLIPNYNNLAKSTNNLLSFAKNIVLDNRNNMLVDSALLLGGQGKSTVQLGLRRAVEEMGLSCALCHLPSVRDGVQDVFVKNEVCIDDESHFENIDLDSLNKILDKSVVTIKGKYIKEWSARSISNLLVGTNFLPTDVNARRYSVRMVDETFKLEQNYGRYDIPGIQGDVFGDSYDRVVKWTTEAWLNLFYYCNYYDIPDQPYQEASFDFSLLYQLKKAIEVQGTTISTVKELVRAIEQVNDDVFDWRTKQSYANKLFTLANQLKLEIVGERKRSTYNTYDWEKALEIDEALPDNPLEKVYCYYKNCETYKIDDSGDEVTGDSKIVKQKNLVEIVEEINSKFETDGSSLRVLQKSNGENGFLLHIENGDSDKDHVYARQVIMNIAPWYKQSTLYKSQTPGINSYSAVYSFDKKGLE